MNLNDAKKILQDQNVPEFLYAIQSLGAGECSEIGQIEGRWITYYSERGQRTDITEHPTEELAVRKFLKDVEAGYQTYFKKSIQLLPA